MVLTQEECHARFMKIYDDALATMTVEGVAAFCTYAYSLLDRVLTLLETKYDVHMIESTEKLLNEVLKEFKTKFPRDVEGTVCSL